MTLPVELALAYSYAQVMDDRAFEKLGDIMWDDVLVEGPGYSYEGLSAFQAGLDILRNYESTFHFVGNQTGAWVGDSFRGETYCIASHVYQKEGEAMKLDMAIRYQDCMVRKSGLVKFQSRILRLAWVQDLPLSVQPNTD